MPGGNYIIIQIGAVLSLWYVFSSGLLMLLFSDPEISWMRKAFFCLSLQSLERKYFSGTGKEFLYETPRNRTKLF